MRDDDGRKLDHATLEAIRIRAIQQIEAGIHPEDIATALGFNRSTVFGWIAKYREGGVDALRSKPVPGRQPKMSGDNIARLYTVIVGADPRQLQFDFALWTREMVRTVIQREFGISLSAVSVGRLLRKMGLSPQRPVWRATQQDPEAVRRWREQEYPAIRAESEQVNATIYFGDEAGIRMDYHAGTTWAPVGQTPVVASSGDRKSVSMLSAIGALGELHFDLQIGTVNSAVFVDFCRKLLADDGGTVFLIVDRSRVHTSKETSDFVESTNGRLKLYFLPSYSPELNPDEWVWKNVKHDRIGRTGADSQTHLFSIARQALTRLKQTPAIVRGFFRDPALSYIAG